MTFNVRDIILASSARESAAYEPRLSIIKAHTVAIDATDSCLVTGKNGYKWVREEGLNGGVYDVPGMKVPDIVDLPVLVGYHPKQPWLRMILDADWDALLNMSDYTGETYTPNHHTSHEWPDYAAGNDVVNLYPRAYVPLRVYPGSSGLTISVAPHRYVWQNVFVEYDGEVDISVSSLQPASGYAVRVLAYLDKTQNVAVVIAGDQIADTPIVTPQPPSFPRDAFWSALIRLDGDQTTISETDILDIRGILSNDANAIEATARGQILICIDGSTFEPGIPMTDANGDIITDIDGYIVVAQ